MSLAQHRWIATHDEPLAAVLERLQQTRALGEGRVFVDGRRANDASARLAQGTSVEVYAERAPAGELRILRSAGGLAFVDKPAGIATEPERRGTSECVTHLAARQLGCAPERVHALSRLDVGVSGVVLLGLDSDANQRVMAARAAGRVRRRYLALTAACPLPQQGAWAEAIARRGAGNRRVAAAGGEPALTRYATLATVGALPSEPAGSTSRSPSARVAALLALDPETGRTHQLRVHAAFHGVPLLGDRSYGGVTQLVLVNGAVHPIERIALHCLSVQVAGDEPVCAAFPPDLTELWRALGGDPEALSPSRTAAPRA